MSGHDAGAGAAKAAAGLTEAITRTTRALGAIPDDDDAAAWECLRDLDVALRGLADLLGSVPRIVKLGDPAPALRERLERSQAGLAAQRADVAAYRATLESLAETERQAAETTAVASQLRDRVAQLDRAKQTASEIPGLRAAAAALETDLAALDAADAAEVGARLASAIGRLAGLTERQRAAMSETAAESTAKAETAAGELAALRARRDTADADLARLDREAEQLREEHGSKLSLLTAWAAADSALAEGLRTAALPQGATSLDRVRAELAGITQRLSELDELLGPLLGEHARAYEEARQPRPLA